MADYDYDLIVVGSGYAASTYLFTADLSWCKKIMVIGGADAWKSTVRGDGIVNHARYIYERDNPGADRPSEPATRASLKDENETILKKAIQWLKKQGIEVNGVTDARNADQLPVPGNVKKIERNNIVINEAIATPTTVLVNGKQQPVFSKATGDAATRYTITYDQWNEFPGDNWENVEVNGADLTKTAMKIVYCGGAGPHADFYNRNGTLNASTYIDLDTYMRGPAHTDTGKKVAVIGPNAGIDAAIKAMANPDNFYWLISGPQNSKPAWLSTKHYTVPGIDDADVIRDSERRIVNYPRADRFTIAYNNQAAEQKYTITFKNPVTVPGVAEQQTTLKVDYIVYATGQDPNKSEKATGANAQITTRIGPANVLQPILDKEKLTPIYDTNKRFGHGFATALGLQDSARTNFTGLEVLGASAVALANYRGGGSVKQAFFSNFGEATRSLDRSIQKGQVLEDALSAVKDTTWADRSTGTRLYDYFDDLGSIPSVGDSMNAVLKKLYQQSLTAADQLGTIKSQIEAITGFDIIAASTDRPEITKKAHSFMEAIQSYQKKVVAYKNALQALEKKQDDQTLQTARDSAYAAVETEYTTVFKPASDAFGTVEDTANQAAKAYVELLDKEDQAALKKQGFESRNFAYTVNDKVWTLNMRASPARLKPLYFSTYIIDLFLQTIPATQRWLTNLLAIYQVPAGQVGGVLNFNSMDRTQLAVLLAVQYPSIAVSDWPEITQLILEGRRVSPWGYNAEQVAAIEAWLKGINDGTKAVGEFPELNTA